MTSIVKYRPEFEDGIKALCRIPVSGNISLALEREPSYLPGAYVQCELPEIYVAYDASTGAIWAVMNIGIRRLWLDGKIVNVRYLSDLRIHPEKQQGTIFYLLIKHFRATSAMDELPAQTVVFADNRKMIALIEKRSHEKRSAPLPYYHFMGRLTTLMLDFKQRPVQEGRLKIRRAMISDKEVMQSFFDTESSKINYHPYYRFSALSEPYYAGQNMEDYFLAFDGNLLVGICGTWDLTEIKQTRITGYSLGYQLLKPVHNLMASLLGWQKLPAAGAMIRYINLHCVLTAGRNPDILRELFSVIRDDFKNKGYDYILCSLCDMDPLMAAFKSNDIARKLSGNYYCVNDGSSLPENLKEDFFYLEAARI